MTDRLAGLALGALAVLTAVLVGVAVDRQTGLGGRDSEASSPISGRADTGPESAPARTDEEPTSQASLTEPAESPAAARVADGRDDLLAHAATARTCLPDAAPAELVVVHDGETTRTTVEDITVVTGIQVVDTNIIRVVGADGDCEVTAVASTDRGETWRPREAAGFWSLLPGDETALTHASGNAAVPCSATSVSGIDLGVARVLCEDGRVLGTADAGVEWVALGSLDDAKAVSYATPAVGYGLVEHPECDGVQVRRTTDGGSSWSDLHCADLQGPWAISANDSFLLVAGADGHVTSADAGETWR